jgi:hypothetical protein
VFPGGKGGRCVKLTTLPPSCAVVVKSGNLNFPEPSGPLQACNGADSFTFYYDLQDVPCALIWLIIGCIRNTVGPVHAMTVCVGNGGTALLIIIADMV